MALAALASWCALASGAISGPPCSIPSSHRYARSLRRYMADLKSSFPESGDYPAGSALTEANSAAVLSGLVTNVGVNGIRVPMIPDYGSPSAYPEFCTRVIATARRLGLAIYARPLSFGPEQCEGWSEARYAAWIAAYVATFRPDFVSPFNEAGFTGDQMRGILRALRHDLPGPTVLIGPDRKLVAGDIAELETPPLGGAAVQRHRRPQHRGRHHRDAGDLGPPGRRRAERQAGLVHREPCVLERGPAV